MMREFLVIAAMLAAVREGTGSTEDLLEYVCTSSGCANEGTCDADSKQCTCQGSPTNPNVKCEVPAVGGTCSGCSAENTINTAECDPYTPAVCFCKAGYTGDTCEEKQVAVTCTGSGMDIKVSPYKKAGVADPFNGFIYLHNSNDFGDFGDDTIAPECKTDGSAAFLETDIGFSAGGACNIVVTAVDGGEAYKVYVYIQQNPDFRSQADQIVTITCGATLDITDPTGIEITHADDVNGNPALDATFAIDPIGLTMAVKNDDNTAIGGSIKVGHPIAVILQYAQLFTVKSCTAFSAAPGTAGAKSVPLMVDWCVDPGALSLFRGPLVYAADATLETQGGTGTSGYLIRLQLAAWYFLGSTSNNLFIQCTACINCAPGSPACYNSYSSFSSQQVGFFERRRKRSNDEATDETYNATLLVSVQVTEGHTTFTDIGTDGARSPSVRSCYSDTVVLLPLVLLAVLLAAACTVALFFCTRLTNQQHDNKINRAAST